MPLSPKTRLGTYEILGPLGAGGMGEVYRARDHRLGRDVAVKVLPAEVTASPDRLARLEREARTLAGLNHPNIVTLFSVENTGGAPFLTMELVEGQTLSNLVAPGGLPLPQILDLMIPLTDALVAAHERGVIHRDLKPGNVMVTREGRVKVLDFGLAKMVRAEASGQDVTLTVSSDGPISGVGQVQGTAPYMAPEQLRGETLDARSDLFALGIILYELAAGRRPFTGETSVDISHAILRNRPEPLGLVRADLPADLDRIVSQCLEKEPRLRIQSALDVNNELHRLRKALEHPQRKKPASEKVASIAVLPFVNRSASADDEYFSDGLADELLNVLSKIKGLRVTARSSAFTFKGKQATAADIGQALRVATLLEGSVRKVGTRIRVSVQLVSVADSSHLWSESYDRTLEDIFAVQDDIAQSVVKELRTTLLGEEAGSDANGAAKADVAQAARGRGTDAEAYRLYLLARHLGDRYTREDTTRAIGYLKDALARDPDYALAYAELGNAYRKEADYFWVPVDEGYRRAREAVERAMVLEPDLVEGLAHLGMIRMIYDRDLQGAEASFSRALELLPDNAVARFGMGDLLTSLGRMEDAIENYRRVLEQDPLSARTYHNLGFAFRAWDRFPEAEAALRKALELAPQAVATRAVLSMTLLALGRGEDALAEAMREAEEPFRLWALGIVHHRLGNEAESDVALQDLLENHAEGAACLIAEVYTVRGEMDRAFEWLARAYAQRDTGLVETKTSPSLRSLHGDRRWDLFLKKVGFGD